MGKNIVVPRQSTKQIPQVALSAVQKSLRDSVAVGVLGYFVESSSFTAFASRSDSYCRYGSIS